MGLEPGYLVSKHVKLVRMLKRGGMGSVWVADHLALQTQVAVKFMSGVIADDPAMVTRFAREATYAAQIKSPHVVHVHDHGVTPEGDPFIVMELLEGEDLASRMKRLGPLPLEEVATVLLQTCRVLGKAHQIGIVHRDIKPSNIFLVDTEGDIFIKVLDFGVAKLGGEGSEITTTGAMVGTVVYMSPEQLLSARRVDHRADLWSLAVVAYRAITAELPFKDDEGLGALCRALEQGIFFPPSEFTPNLPPEVDAWFERAFQREPGDRFASAREFAESFFVAIGMGQVLMPASSSPASLLALRETLNARRQELSVSARSVRNERPSREEKATRAERGFGVSARSRAERELAEMPVDVLSQAGSSPRAASASGSRGEPSSFADEPGSLGGAPALTLTGAELRPAARRGSFAKKLAVVGAGLAALVGLVALGARIFGLPMPGLARQAPDGITSDPAGANVAPATRQAPATAPSAQVSLGGSPGALSSGSAAPSASTLPSGSAAPPAASGGRFPLRQGGAARPNRPEKDYGF